MSFVALVAVGWCLAMRIFELALSRRNLALLAPAGARVVCSDGMAWIAAVHALWFACILAEGFLYGASFDALAVRAALGALFIASEALRAWCIVSLGPRWSVRVVTVPGAPLVRRGPYRFAKHPNYAAVVIGLVALPLSMGLVFTPLLVLPLKLAALARRIGVEERALAR